MSIGRGVDAPPDSGVPAADRPKQSRWSVVRRWGYTLPGLWVALLFVCLSLSPSLLPRSALLQGLVCGITGAIGYGLGVLAAWVWRAFADRAARPARRRSWQVFAVIAVIALVGATLLGGRWQDQIRRLMGVPPDHPATLLIVPLVAVIVFVVLIGLCRGLRRLYRWLAGLLARWIGPRAARAVGWAIVVVGTALLINGVVLDGLASVADRSFSVTNGTTEAGVVQPTIAQRSGSPASLVPWSSLGQQGRTFAGTGPSAEQIATFTGTAATVPIRAYAGLDSAETAEQRAALAVDDLVRAGGFGRKTLVVVTTTGSGWVDPGLVDSV